MRTIASFSTSVNSARSSLLAANARLLALRAKQQKIESKTGLPDGERRRQRDNELSVSHSAESTPQTNPSNWLSSLHEALSNPINDIAQSNNDIDETISPTHVTTFGTIAAAILKHDGGTVGRLWIVLRAHFANEGQSGMVSAESLWHCLSTAFPQYSQRHLRDLLNRGEGIYWKRDGFGRLWLTGITKVAERLEVERLQGVRVVIPLADLTGKLTQMRTALQAAFHVSRKSDNPISRATLRDLTGISERSQREQENEHRELIDSQANYSLDGVATSISAENHAFRYKQNSFHFTDKREIQGKSGNIHLAHQLPNSYTAHYPAASRGRKRKINRQLNRVNQGARGTDWQQVETVFCGDGAEGVNRFEHGSKEIAYPSCTTKRGSRIWITL